MGIFVKNIIIFTLCLNYCYSSIRLPSSIHPFHYDIQLRPFVNGNLSIHGTVNIWLEVYKDTDKIILNMADIITINETVKVSQINPQSTEEITVTRQTYDTKFQTYTAYLNRKLQSSHQYLFKMSFIGYLNNKLVGFYLSTYKDSNNTEKHLAATQFSPTDARRAFPCFDEPSFKATFNITLIREQNMSSRSNMPIERSVPLSDGWIADYYGKTPKMSTYIVGFMVSDFKVTQTDALQDIEFNVITRPDFANLTDYSTFVAPKVLLFLEKYFGIKYPLPKLDMVALPDFKFNGMENWGLINYRETAMLYDPQVTTVSAKRSAAATITHEIAHMWFGNLVTPEWWSELWLKEGFANFMKYISMEKVEPEWHLMENAVEDALVSSLQLDAMESSHPINVKLENPDQIPEIFDAISYRKGVSIIRMMHGFLTDEIFKAGMKYYLDQLSYSNAVQNDLWHYLTKAWEESHYGPQPYSVKDIMDTWTLQKGYPVVYVTRNQNIITLTQTQFLFNNKSPMNNTMNKNEKGSHGIIPGKWRIPVSYSHSKNPDFGSTFPKIWLHPENDTVSFDEDLRPQDWIILNNQFTGFYRVNYEQRNWDRLADQLMENLTLIPVLNRAQIIDDSMNLARAGFLDYSFILKMLEYMKYEKAYTPWAVFLQNYNYIYDLAKFKLEKIQFQHHIRRLIKPLFKRIGFEDSPTDSYHEQFLRKSSIGWACAVGYEPCINKAKDVFKRWLSSEENNLIEFKNVLPTILCTGIRHGNEKDWNKTFEKYLSSKNPSIKNNILYALSCSKDTVILKRYIDKALDSNGDIKKQDSYSVLRNVAGSEYGRHLVWNILKERWNFFIDYYGSGSQLLWRILETTGSSFGSEDLLKELKNFKKKNIENLGSTSRVLNQAIEKAELNIQWMQDHYSDVVAALTEEKNHASTLMPSVNVIITVKLFMIITFLLYKEM